MGFQFFQGNTEGRSDCSAAFCRRSCFTSGGVVSLFLELHFLVWFNWNFRKHPLRELQVSVREAWTWLPVCVYAFNPSPGLFTGSAWTHAAPGEASAPAWLSSRSSPWWLSTSSSYTPWISRSHFLALRTSSIIRSPLLPGQGRHHRARVAHPTSWTLSEEWSSAFFLLQRRRSSPKIGHSCGLQLSAATHAAAITFKSVMA